MMKYEDFLRKIKNKEIKIDIDKTVALQLMDKRNGIVDLMSKNVVSAHKLWVMFFTVLFATGIIGTILSAIIGFAQWYLFLGFVFVSLYGSKKRVVGNAIRFIKEELIENEEYYNYLMNLEKLHNRKYLIIEKVEKKKK